MTGPIISKQSTERRKALMVQECLSVTVRYLAKGMPTANVELASLII